ncbi:MAG: membrane-binding protein [Bacteroidota bacterium]
MKRIVVVCLTAFVFSSGNFIHAAPTPVVYKAVTDDAREIIADIIAVIGLKPNFEIRSAAIENAAATNYNGKRYIVYNPQFFTKLNIAAGNKWASVSVLAHEIGHHLNGHTLSNTGSQPALEIEADEFSGFVMQKMGATLAQAQAAMKIAAGYKPSLTHPGQAERLLAIQKGWNSAGGKPSADIAKYNQPVLPPVGYEQQRETAPARDNSEVSSNAVLDKSYVLAKVDFPSDPTAEYFVTTRFNIVKVANGKLYMLGKMVRTNSSDYPFIFTGNGQNNNLYVDRYGKIVTANRKFAGYLRMA